MLTKKALSPVIATIGIILLTIAAIGFIAGFVVPFVRDRLQSSTVCIDYENYFTFYEEFDYNCYSQSGPGWLYSFSIRAESVDDEIAEEIKGFKILFLKEDGSESLEVTDGKDAGENVGETRMLNASVLKLEIPESGGVRTYVYNSTDKYVKMEIYPGLKSGRFCEKSDSISVENIICTKPLIIN